MRKIVIGMTVAGLVATSVVVAGCGAGGSQEASAPVQAQTVPVEVEPVLNGTLDKGRTLTGTTQPSQVVNVVSKVSAKVTSLPVKVGQKVNAGDVLFRLDDKELRDTVAQSQEKVALARASLAQTQAQTRSGVNSAESGVNQANSALAQANSSYEQAQNSIMNAYNDMGQANAQLEKAQQGYEDAKTNAERMEMLFKQGATTKKELEQAQTLLKNAQIAIQEAQIQQKKADVSLKNAEASKRSAEESRKNAQSSLATAKKQVQNAGGSESIEVARKQLAQEELNLRIARDNLNNAVVVAPISGTIGAINGEIGDFSSPQSPFMVLANLDPMKVIINAPENLIGLFAMNQTVGIEIPSLKHKTNGKIVSISPLNQQSKGYPVTVEVPNPEGIIKGGMAIQVNVASPTAKQGLIIPTSAILTEENKPYVYVAQGDKPVRKPITIVEQNSERTMVTGLQQGEKIIFKGQSLIGEDVKIAIKK
ncbi:efflux RND transporter periplasmic adaptor subunit [Aneurinibacillus aneurinilyticus]|uniref:efflux RND transporter periplasmic adaptor subunit n=1 Tax=Aneurinibacillus aneurinilyticus TaxID=1391 RepID=UPI0023F355EF|nr:efflux RND transporter periplasmic adaptor subunit [Aneurinibacillus aneurinilyticus]